MVKEFIFKVFVISAVIFASPLYAQTDDVSKDIKKSCKAVNENENAMWSDSENLCSISYTFDEIIIHYVGGWSVNGASDYGQMYVYNLKDGNLKATYKGRFKDHHFHGFGHFEETYLNNDGESVTRITIGNWKDDKADGFVYQKLINNVTQEIGTFYGEMKGGNKNGNSIVFTGTKHVDKVVWEDGKYKSHDESVLLKDEVSYGWVQYKYFDNDVLRSSEGNNVDININKISAQDEN